MSGKKHTLAELDGGQLDIMWQFLRLRPEEQTCTRKDVEALEENLDVVRRALIQKTAGQRRVGGVDYNEIGTYINIIVACAMTLYLYGGLAKLKEVLPNE